MAHAIEQGEGGEQGDPFMPDCSDERMQGSERLFAFLDILTSLARVAPVHAIVAEELGSHAHQHQRVQNSCVEHGRGGVKLLNLSKKNFIAFKLENFNDEINIFFMNGYCSNFGIT